MVCLFILYFIYFIYIIFISSVFCKFKFHKVKMKVNPVNVIRMLLIIFEAMEIPDSPIINEEIELKDSLYDILLRAMNDYNGVEIFQYETLDFQEPYKDMPVETVEDEIEYIPPAPKVANTVCTQDLEPLSYGYKMRAVNYWRSGKKKNLSLDSVKQKFKKVQSLTQLRRWAHQLNQGGTYHEKVSKISEYTLNNFKSAINSGLIIHDIDLQKWALHVQKDLGFDDLRFTASKKWLWKFKNAHRITSRKINKFISRKTLENTETLRNEAEHFIVEVKPLIAEYGLENVYNSDQSGFQLEIHSGRTLAVEGTKTVECIVQSVSSTTHSYTIQPTITADGKLLSPLFIVLKEPTGTFGPRVEDNLFQASNVYVMASKSGKLTSDHFKKWLEDVFFPNVGSKSLLLIDSWSGHCPEVINEAKPQNKEIVVKIIPKGTTGKIQPLDVYGFRIWKNFIRHFSDSVLLLNHDINLHLRNNIIKLQSLTHNQLSSPRYVSLFRYSWYKSGYVLSRPNKFENPVDFAFGQTSHTLCEIEGCNNIAVIQCSWCKKSLCFKHFFHDYHYCTNYND